MRLTQIKLYGMPIYDLFSLADLKNLIRTAISTQFLMFRIWQKLAFQDDLPRATLSEKGYR
ncbi:MAG: hypothetical protein ACJA2G_000748 [Cognaticolwellia sp.]|jgi:hypothetical protein